MRGIFDTVVGDGNFTYVKYKKAKDMLEGTKEFEEEDRQTYNDSDIFMFINSIGFGIYFA